MILTLLGLEAGAVGVMWARERRAAIVRKLGRIRSESRAIRWVSRQFGVERSWATAWEQRLAAGITTLIRRLTQHQALDQIVLSAVQYLGRKRKGGYR